MSLCVCVQSVPMESKLQVHLSAASDLKNVWCQSVYTNPALSQQIIAEALSGCLKRAARAAVLLHLYLENFTMYTEIIR